MYSRRRLNLQRSAVAEVRVAERFEVMSKAPGDGEPEPVVGGAAEVVGASGFEAEVTAAEHEGNVVVGVGVAFAEFVGPEDGGVVQHGAVSAGLGGIGEAFS